MKSKVDSRLDLKLTYNKFKPPRRYRKGVKANNPRVQEHMRKIERVPDQLQRIIADHGSYIVFFNGPLTDNWEVEHLKGEIPPGWEDTNHKWEDLRAAYAYFPKAVLIGIEGDYAKSDSEASLHEYGHSFDDLIGREFYKMPLSSTPKVKDILKRKRELYSNKDLKEISKNIAESIGQFLNKHSSKAGNIERLIKEETDDYSRVYFKCPDEFAALCVEKFYMGPITRFIFEIMQPEMRELFYELEKKALQREKKILKLSNNKL